MSAGSVAVPNIIPLKVTVGNGLAKNTIETDTLVELKSGTHHGLFIGSK